MSAHLLAKLTAHGIQITGEGHGGMPQITESDVAGAMAGMRRVVYQFMRLKYCADKSMLRPVVERVTFRLLGDAMYESLRVGEVKRLSTLIVHQATEGPLCETCNGTGTILSDENVKDCRPCRGTGRRRMSQERAADFMEVSRPTYVKSFQHLVDDEVASLESLEQEGFDHLRRQFYTK